jgi:SSS family transporter
MVRMTAHLRPLDLAIVALYLIGITLFGLRFRQQKGASKADRSLKSYFLANNTIPWWAIALSIVSAETSTLTIISIPGVAFAGDFGFLQIVLGYMLGRIVVAALFLPRYFSGNMMTAYQLIDRRFGPVLHKVTAGLFLLTRAAAEGVRVFAVSIVVGIAIGTRDVLSIAIISALTLLYTFEGGMAAVIWTDVVQMAIYIAGTFVAIWSLGRHIPGGWATIHTVAGAAGKFHLFNFAFNLTTTYTFWAGILGGTFLTMASHGTDQLMVQRMLAARSLRESRLALLSSGVVIFIQFALFLLIGVGLWVFYGPSGPWALNPGPSHSPDRIFPTFIVHELPLGIAGLLVAAILAAAMSNLSAALNSLSSTTVVDFYMHLRPNANARERTLISKSSTVLWALVLFAIAVATVSVGGKGHVVEIGLSIASVAYGCLLGVFLLGTLTKFATQTGATIGMICGFALNLWLWQGTFPKTIWQGDIMSCPNATNVTPGVIDISHCSVPALTIPHIAFTWYVLIGALVTFAIGTLFSLIFRKQARRSPAVITALVLLFCLSFPKGICVSAAAQSSLTTSAALKGSTSAALKGTGFSPSVQTPETDRALAPEGKPPASAPDFTPITTLLNEAIAAHKLPGAVVLIGHNGKIVFEQAYGNRKLAGEPGLDGKPSPAEPMTEDTIFDMASLTKCLATATAIMQLYEAGKIASFDDPVEKYLPAFNPQHDGKKDETRAKVTLRMLLTHTSGEAPDVDLKDPWGLAAPDRAEGFRRALTTPLKATLANPPGSHFEYSDINFILLGDLVETLSGEREDVYAAEHIFQPLGMIETGYHPFDRTCGPVQRLGANVISTYNPRMGRILFKCLANTWQPGNERIAPTAHDNEGTPATNPDFDHLLRGTVHDPTTRRMGGVAGHAGVFSTAHDISLFAQALLDKLTKNTGPFPLKQSTLQLMTQPEQPGHNPQQIPAANAAEQADQHPGGPSIAGPHPAMGGGPQIPGLAPHYPAIKGQSLRGFGWDIDTGFSKPRGAIFPIGSFGHTGFTGTSLWMDPASNTYVILLANAIHPRGGNGPISNLRGQVATAAAKALRIDVISELKTDYKKRLNNDVYGTDHPCPKSTTDCPGVEVTAGENSVESEPTWTTSLLPSAHLQLVATTRYPEALASGLIAPPQIGLQPLGYAFADTAKTLTGIDVLESTHFAFLTSALAHSCPSSSLAAQQKPCHLGLLTNQTGVDAQGRRTIDILNSLTTYNVQLTTLFSPEHGVTGTLDTEKISSTEDSTTHLPIVSLYGAHDADRRPTHAQLADLDAVIIDLQDAGVRFWTYEAATSYFLDAAATEQTQYHHDLQIILLDRPNLIGGAQTQGPLSDPGTESYVNTMPLPVRHGLTLGELARYYGATHHLATQLTVIPMQHWTRTQTFAQTGLPWVNPSPNLRSPAAALLYPALGLIETTNISVGRGTSHPFEFFGAGIPPVPTPHGSTRTLTTSGYSAAQPRGNAGPPTLSGQIKVISEPARAIPGKPWFNAEAVADALTARHIPGVTFLATILPIANDGNHYPYYGQSIPAVKVTLTDPTLSAGGISDSASGISYIDTPELGIEILAVLHRLYPTQFQLDKVQRLLCNQSTLDALIRGDDPRDIAATWAAPIAAFRADTRPFLLYP